MASTSLIHILAVLMIALLILAVPAASQEPTAEDLKRGVSRFEMYNDCLPIGLTVERMDDDATVIGLSRESLLAAAESRLRAARLYTEGHWKNLARLYVNVNVTPSAFSCSVNFEKFVTDAFGLSNQATTWRKAFTGTHGGNASFILSSLSELLDLFMVEYLRVNEEACEAK